MGSKLIKTGKIRIGSAPLKGDHQIENTMIVLTAVKTLNGLGFKATSKDIKDGLRSTRWPGRMQVLKTSPLMILDGAHNPAGAKALCRHLRTYGKKFAIVVGMQSNKDIEKYLEEIDPVASDYIAVCSGNKNAADANRIAKTAEKFRKNVLVASNLEHAEFLAKSLKKPICVTGSLYLIGDIMRQKLFDL
jgi:dihydrofolate synthase/folylpolyglutamate synthase